MHVRHLLPARLSTRQVQSSLKGRRPALRALIVTLACGITLAAAVTPAGAAQIRDLCPPVTYQPLHADTLNPANVPSPPARLALNLTATLAERATPGDPCRAFIALNVFQREVNFFANIGLVTSTGRSILTSDAAALTPTDPC